MFLENCILSYIDKISQMTPSRLITPPDKFYTDYSYLIINAIDTDIDLVALWLRTVPENYDIHLYHVEMKNDYSWFLETVMKVKFVLVNTEFYEHIGAEGKFILTNRSNVIFFGNDTPYKDLVQFFIQNRQ